MLIDDALQEAKRQGKLISVHPVAHWASEPRAFLMCDPLWKDIQAGRNDVNESIRQRWAALEAAMQFFVEGGYVTQDRIKHLRPMKLEHWELRNRKPRPSLRVFGRFAMPNVFVGTHVKRRDSLGGMWSMEFEMEKLVCEDYWQAAGLPTEPAPGAFTDFPLFRYESYITENASRAIEVPK